MDIVEGILKTSQAIYGQCQRMKSCKKQRARLVERMELLLQPIRLLRHRPAKELSPELTWVLQKMLVLMKETQQMFGTYEGWNHLEKFVKAGDMLEKFAYQNERFGNVGQALLLQLQVEQKILANFEKGVVNKQGSQDLAEDKVCWKEMLRGEGADGHLEITEIDKRLLVKTTPVSEMKHYTLYKGEYYKSPVAIKVFKNPLTTNTKAVRKVFTEEIRTLKRLESPYILRMYGICIDDSGPIPEFSIVVEYCEKGTLREVLTKEPGLSWKIRAEMASDAAAGLYRLHQAADKGHMRRYINSTKFLVAKGYCVKLSGFKLDQTESSISQKSKEKHCKEVASSAYICPQGLASVNHPHDLASEIYSFGIVLWEIVTGKIPFAGCTSVEIYEKVYKQRYQEPLGEGCPSYLRDIINLCRDFEPSKRPSAEAIVNQLLVAQDGGRDSLSA
ncbi:mixed lineage kinase domain-like protein [Varanus komodoensis]|uniref:mixed lineage kinase domain-like protein n=1 Tax=Varanus komodoensis TaxID=61221 RepID=UPI001CF789F1|nr:mixed lineage kinase domain-like protein [Varanus komodoensis]